MEDASGRVVGQAPLPSVAAPVDLLPKVTQVRVPLPRGFNAAGARVRLLLAGGVAEITQRNNVVTVPAAAARQS